ncbi:MAG: hypothetical protein ABH852_03535 [Methanobacteriota archaeon]
MKIKKKWDEEEKKAIEERRAREEAQIEEVDWGRKITKNGEPVHEDDLVRLARWKAFQYKMTMRSRRPPMEE